MATKCVTFRRKTRGGARLKKPVTVCFKRKVAKKKAASKRRRSGLPKNVCRRADGRFKKCSNVRRGAGRIPGAGLLRNKKRR